LLPLPAPQDDVVAARMQMNIVRNWFEELMERAATGR